MNNNQDQWTIEDLVNKASNWTLAGNVGLLKVLENISQEIFLNAEQTGQKLDDLVNSLEKTSVELDLVKNRFLGLQNTQFIERRVYEEDECIVDNAFTQKHKTNDVDNNNLKVEAFKQAVKEGIEILDNYYEKISIPESDSEADEDQDVADFTSRYILQPKDLYSERPLPCVIGSEDWYRTSYASSDECDEEQENEDETAADEEIKTRKREEDSCSIVSSTLASISSIGAPIDEVLIKEVSENNNHFKPLPQVYQIVKEEGEEINKRPIMKSNHAELLFNSFPTDEPPPLFPTSDEIGGKGGLFDSKEGLFDSDSDSSKSVPITTQKIPNLFSDDEELPEEEFKSKNGRLDVGKVEAKVPKGGVKLPFGDLLAKRRVSSSQSSEEDENGAFSAREVLKSGKQAVKVQDFARDVKKREENDEINKNDKEFDEKDKEVDKFDKENDKNSVKADKLSIGIDKSKRNLSLFDDPVDLFNDDDLLFVSAATSAVNKAEKVEIPAESVKKVPESLFESDESDAEIREEPPPLIVEQKKVRKVRNLFDDSSSDEENIEKDLFGVHEEALFVKASSVEEKMSSFEEKASFDEKTPSFNAETSLYEEKSSLFDEKTSVFEEKTSLFEEKAPLSVEKSLSLFEENSAKSEPKRLNLFSDSPPPLDFQQGQLFHEIQPDFDEKPDETNDEEPSTEDAQDLKNSLSFKAPKTPPKPPKSEELPITEESSAPSEEIFVNSSKKGTTTIGKLNPNQLLKINVGALLPNSGPVIIKKPAQTSKSSSEDEETPKTPTSADLIKENEQFSAPVLKSFTKDRVKFTGKRRPSTRRGRQDALNQSKLLQGFEDSTENEAEVLKEREESTEKAGSPLNNEESFEESALKTSDNGDKSTSFEDIASEIKEKPSQIEGRSLLEGDAINDEETTSKHLESSSEVEQTLNLEENEVKFKENDVKLKENDSKLEENNSKLKENHSRLEESGPTLKETIPTNALFAPDPILDEDPKIQKPALKHEEMVKAESRALNQGTKLAKTVSIGKKKKDHLFSDSSSSEDDSLFASTKAAKPKKQQANANKPKAVEKTVKLKKTSLFSDDEQEEDDLFGGAASSRLLATRTSQSKAQKSLFDDANDASDEDLFSSAAKPSKKSQSKVMPTLPTYDDPLDAFGPN